MLATLREDIIIAVGRGDFEIGRLPAGGGVERLRWDGDQIIDLAEAATIHVRHLSGNHFELHALPLPGTQPVAMRYQDRARLTVAEGIIRLKTEAEIQAAQLAAASQAIRARYARQMAAIAAPYTSEERETWPIQLTEAEAYTADPSAPVAMLAEIASARGISVPDLVAKIMHNNSQFRGAVGRLLGLQQWELDSL